jgi:peptidoglycan/xylan/chitin deacetylase (PgdA/CDA1 family)
MVRAYRSLYRSDPRPPLWKSVGKTAVQCLPDRLILWRGRRDVPSVAITFDDGPEPGYTPGILEILRRFNVRSTFFLIGEKAARHPDLVRHIVAEGHEIANHSYTHPDFGRLSWNAAAQEIAKTGALLAGVQGKPVHLFRPPKGKLALVPLLQAWKQRLTVVMWNVDLKDFRASTPEEITQAVAARPVSAGDIVLYHGNTDTALAALPAVLRATLDRGWKPVPVSQLGRK